MYTFKPILLFLFKYFLVYIVLTFFYTKYLSYYRERQKRADPFTMEVARESVYFLNFLGISSKVVLQPKKTIWPKVAVNERTKSVVTEGCNAISIMILFTSFVFAFSSSRFRTLAFISAGVLAIHLLNVGRIALLNYIYVYHPEYQKIAHDYLFPAIIYGSALSLMILWVVFFAFKKK